MSQRVLIVIDEDGNIENVFGDPDVQVSYFSREDAFNDPGYARDILIEAQHYPEVWKEHIPLDELIKTVEDNGLEPPPWLLERRNQRLLNTLHDLQNF